MKKYLIKWAILGLVWPTFYILSYSFIAWSTDWILLFWPSSIVLMSLGTGPNETWYVAYVWTVGAALNVLTYLVIGLFVKMVISIKQRTEHENS
jgi:putative effector of murein hydrolase LrgA (UPF0299 family)